MQGKKAVEQFGILILDKMKAHQALAFNKTAYKVDGFVDYGENKDSAIPAYHALVLMFVHSFHSWD